MDYQETIDYLYHAAPLFQNIGAGAYKEGLSTTRTLDEHFGHPHSKYRTIHVAGTNGKGSVSSTLAAVLQSAGLRVGLYTSPHLVDFRERIRVNGEMIPEQRVVDFVEQERAFFEPLYPSFFELTTALAFLYFAEQQVDVAVVEVGLGGRLDCTNIITPDLSIITNISFDHQQFLGDTLAKIAAEKAGIIKPGIPVVIGETNGHSDVRDVFVAASRSIPIASEIASSCPVLGDSGAEVAPSSPLRFADEEPLTSYAPFLQEAATHFQLRGSYQRANVCTILCALSELQQQPFYAQVLTPEVIRYGFAHVMELTAFQGRWQMLQEHPKLVCDVGHNEAGIQHVVRQLSEQSFSHLLIVFGMVNDKDYTAAASLFRPLFSRPVTFYLTQPSCQRALPSEILKEVFCHAINAEKASCSILSFSSVDAAVRAALDDASEDDFIFVGGSCYVVADLFKETAQPSKGFVAGATVFSLNYEL